MGMLLSEILFVEMLVVQVGVGGRGGGESGNVQERGMCDVVFRS